LKNALAGRIRILYDFGFGIGFAAVVHPFCCFHAAVGNRLHDRYLVDPASSHMLVSKTKPCMSKYKFLLNETADGSLNQKSFI
jgi:hypothetical protein